MNQTDVFAVASFVLESTREPEGLIVRITDSSGRMHVFWLAEQNWAELSAGVAQALALMKTHRAPPPHRAH
jgi:hypothetical protein